MSITWIDGFDLYTSTNDGTPRYVSWPPFEDYPTGRLGVGQCFHTGGGAYMEFANNFGAATSTLSIGFGAKYEFLGNAATILEFRNLGNEQCNLAVNSGGSVIARRGGTVLGTSASGLLVNNSWSYIEVEFVRHATAGVFKVYVNGVQALNLTGLNTNGSDIDTIRLGANSTQLYLDDLYCTNVATKLGECRVDTIRPTADTSQKDWTPSTGTSNFACVDDTTYDTSDYVSASAPGNKDLYAMADLAFNPLNVYAVQATSFAKKDDATTRTFRNKIKSGSTEGSGATRGLGTSFLIYCDIFEQDPNGSIAWTQSSVNAMTAGIEVVS